MPIHFGIGSHQSPKISALTIYAGMGSTLESSSDDEVVDILNIEDDEGWDDVESDVEKVEVVSLFDDIVFGDVLSMLQYCKKAYKFDLAKVQKDLSE